MPFRIFGFLNKKLEPVSSAITSVLVISGAIIGLWMWISEPVRDWVQAVEDYQAQTLELIEANRNNIALLRDEIRALSDQEAFDRSPAIQFSTRGHRVTSGEIGGRVQFTWRFTKLRECGRARVAVFFRNGRGSIHQFTDLSIVDRSGRGLALPVSDEEVSITYTGRIPDDQGVTSTGDHVATAWVVIDYPDLCPNVPVEISPEVPFQIFDPDE